MDYGKFNSAEELLKGYTQLEKSFTQKCQQLALLQKQQGTSEDSTTMEVSSPTTPTEQVADTIPEAPTSIGETTPTSEQLQQYLEANPTLALKLLQGQAATPIAPTVMMGGGNMSLALPSKPKTIKEATLMAHKLFDNV